MTSYEVGVGLRIQYSYNDDIKCRVDLQVAVDFSGHHGTSSAMNVMNRFLKHIYDLLFKAGKYHEQIRIENNSTGHSYEKLFGRFLDESLTGVVVEDPYIRSAHQVQTTPSPQVPHL